MTANQTGSAPAPQITVFAKSGGHLSKELSLADTGALVKDGSQCRMTMGTAHRCDLDAADDPAVALAGVIEGLKPEHAIALGRLPDGVGASIGVVIEAREGALPDGPISRTAKFFGYTPAPAFLLGDVDTKGAPQSVRDRLKADGIESILAEVVPEITSTSRVLRASTSAGLFV